MRICFVIGSLDRAGAERQLLLVAGGLIKRGHDVVLFVLRPGGQLVEAARSLGVEVIEAKGAITGIVSLRRVLVKRRAEIAYSFMPLGSVAMTTASLGLRRLLKVWGIRAADMDLSLYGLKSRVVARLATLLSSSADVKIANSDAGRRHHIEMGYPTGCFEVIPNGVDCSEFNIEPQVRASFRTANGLDTMAQVVGMVARFDPIKGHRDFADALSIVREFVPDVKVVLVGGGSDEFRMEIRQLLEERLGSEAFLILGNSECPQEAINALDVLVVSSQSEGFPNVALEAMACGVTVVGYPVGDLAQMVIPPCRITDTATPEALAREVIKALADGSLDGARQVLRKHVKTKYSVDSMIDKTESVLIEALRRKPDD